MPVPLEIRLTQFGATDGTAKIGWGEIMTRETDAAATEGQPREKEERKSLAWRLYGWYQWKGRYDWLTWFWSWLTSATGGAVVGTGAVAVTALSIAAYNPNLIPGWLRWWPEPAAVQSVQTVETTRWADNSVVYPIRGIDREGRSATFDVVVATRGITWVRGSSALLTQEDGQIIGAGLIGDVVLTPPVIQGLLQSPEWIGVGIASEEGVPEAEVQRAAIRARTVASWLEAARPDTRPVLMLSLGQFTSGCAAGAATDDTGWQRPLMIIGVREKEAGVDLADALANAMTDKTNMPAPNCYSRFELVEN
ncbi:MAG: hypothetical protein ACFCUN_03145 [Hyphomicrobiaceae bacterium]